MEIMTNEVAYELFRQVMAAFAGIVVLELGAIAYFWKRDRDNINRQFDKHNEKFERHEELILEIQKQVAENQSQTRLAIQELQINREHDQQRFEMFNKNLADDIVNKLKVISPP